MVFGGVETERLQLNEETVWSGTEREWNNPNAKNLLPELRHLLAEGRYHEADELSKGMQGSWNESYQPMGNLLLHFEGVSGFTDYMRELNFETGIASVRYVAGGVTYTREAFVSYPDQLFVLHLTSDQPGKLTFTATLDSPLRCTTEAAGESGFRLLGQCPAHVEPSYVQHSEPIVYREGEGIRFEIRVQAVTVNGTVSSDAAGLHVRGADDVTLLLAARTSFNRTEHRPNYFEGALLTEADFKAAQQFYEELRERHTRDLHGWGQVAIELDCPPAVCALPTDERIAAQGDDPALMALLFQYGRYLLFASSRPGTLPANLQGIWNDEMRPPWSSNWTTNLNTQMNYWHAETANLGECVTSLVDFIGKLSVRGAETARVNYGCRGWTAHHNVDLWLQSAPPGNFGDGGPNWAMWNMAGAWLSQHLWEHYAFGGDETYLRDTAYPLMKGAAEFCLDWLIAQGDYFVTSPSTSPENIFLLPDGTFASLSNATTADMSLIWDLFTHCAQAAEILDLDPDFRARLLEIRSRLLPPKIGQYGQLQEWAQDWDRPDDDHRHISHLIGLYPGSQWTPETTPELCRAAAKSLEMRGDGGTTWSMAWKAACWARLGDGEHAHRLLKAILVPSAAQEVEYRERGGVYPNLFTAHPPFQIDANFGASAAIAEMLLQSHAGTVHLLPALPQAWSKGSVRGLRARGGFDIGISWRGGQVRDAALLSRLGRVCTVRASVPLRLFRHGIALPVEQVGALTVRFATEPGGVYHLTAI
jgi:alpha-L-fucosidase 2